MKTFILFFVSVCVFVSATVGLYHLPALYDIQYSDITLATTATPARSLTHILDKF